MAEAKVSNVLNDKLKKEYEVVVPFSELDDLVNNKITEVQKNYKMTGFRPGKVPMNIIRDKHGMAIMADIAEDLIKKETDKIIKDNDFRLALAPKIEVKTFEHGKDFVYSATLELFPEVPAIDLGKISLEKHEVEISEKDIDEAIERILSGQKNWIKQEAGYKAKKGDAVKIDFLGKIDKVPFEGGEGKDYQLELGSGSFIDDFEDQLIKCKAGDKKDVKVKFPKEYHTANLAGKKAVFEVKVKEVLCGESPKLTDEYVKSNLGIENVEKLRDLIKKQLGDVYVNTAKQNFKEDLFDLLAKNYKIELPVGLVEEQFKRIWASIEEEAKRNPEKFKDEKEKKKTEEENRKAAEKMVLIGIILSEIGHVNKVEVNDEDLMKEISKMMAQFPGQEQQFMEYYQKNQQALNDLRGTIQEGKVIDFIMDKINLKKIPVSASDFQKKQEERVKKAKK